MIEVHQLPARADNYIYVLREPERGRVTVVDPTEAAPVEAFLAARGWGLDAIFITHHHSDHIGGVGALVARHGCVVYGSARDRGRIRGITEALKAGDAFRFGGERVQVFGADGHTLGHIVFWFPESGALFAGDTIFSLGCGKLFEGGPREMWASLAALRALPDEARVYCAHEYTEENSEFARRVEPGNAALAARILEVKSLRKRGLPTVPSSLGSEKACNPFLRPESPELQARLNVEGKELWEIFAATREAKDRFDSGGAI